MNGRFLLPGAIAAALHLGVLFGVRPASAKPPVAVDLITCGWPGLKFPQPTPQEYNDLVSEGVPGEVGLNIMERFELRTQPPGFELRMSDVPKRPVEPPPDWLALGRAPGALFCCGEETVAVGDLDHTPRPLMQVVPLYPLEAKIAGRTGRVLVEFVVDEAGAVVEPRAVESTDGRFNAAALRAVAQWRFEIGLRAGRPVRYVMTVPMVFSLAEGE